MAKNFSKLVLFSAIVGAVAGGAYYYLQKKAKTPKNDSDGFDDADGFDEELDKEDFSSDTAASDGNKPHPLPIDIENAKEIIGEKVIERLDRTKGRIDKAMEIISEMTSPATEPVYTEMNLSAGASVSAAYAEPSGAKDPSEEFLDDSVK